MISRHSKFSASLALLGLMLGFSPSAPAQGQKVGFFVFVNAVGLATDTMLAMDGKTLRGFKSGEATGEMGVLAGPHTLTASNTDCKPSTFVLQVDPTASPIVIAYEVEARDPNGKIVRELRFSARGNAPPATGKTYSAIYAGKASSVYVSFNGQNQTIPNFRETRVEVSGALTVKSGNDVIATYAPDEAGNYLVVLYDKPDSKVGAVVVRDVIPHTRGG
jgi:hypothetical protein